MSEFKKYIDIERLGKEDSDGILLGTCYIFPKIDGTNASIWLENGEIHFGSRTRDLSVLNVNDNFDFRSTWGYNNHLQITNYLELYPHYTLYGEYLVPHSLKTYRQTAWKKFYVFDVYNNNTNEFLSYEEYKSTLEAYGIEYIPILKIIENPSIKQLEKIRDENTYLIENGQGSGEGIVIKQYNWTNKFHRIVYGKLVRNKFTEANMKAFGGDKIQQGEKLIETEVVLKFVTKGRINKILEKMKAEKPWEQKRIPELLNKVYNDFVTEEIWEIIKEWKRPIINFKILFQLSTGKIKELKQELF